MLSDDTAADANHALGKTESSIDSTDNSPTSVDSTANNSPDSDFNNSTYNDNLHPTATTKSPSTKKRRRLDPVLQKVDANNWHSPCGLGASRGSRHSFNSILAGMTTRDKKLKENHEAWSQEKQEILKRQEEEKKQHLAQLSEVVEQVAEPSTTASGILAREEDFNESDTVVIFSKRLFTRKLIQNAREMHKPKKPKAAFSPISTNNVNYEDLPFSLSREQLSTQLQALAKYNRQKQYTPKDDIQGPTPHPKTQDTPPPKTQDVLHPKIQEMPPSKIQTLHDKSSLLGSKQVLTIAHFEQQLHEFLDKQRTLIQTK